jgi:nicotinamidase-related amidase
MADLSADWALLVIDLQNDFLDRRGYYGLRTALGRDPEWWTLNSAAQAACLEQAAESTAPGFITPDAERMVDNVIQAVAPHACAETRIASTFPAGPAPGAGALWIR